jgi:phosphotransferase system HPr-like phosphotransfer protein
MGENRQGRWKNEIINDEQDYYISATRVVGYRLYLIKQPDPVILSNSAAHKAERRSMKRSLTEVITEDEFRKLAQEHSRNFLRLYNYLHTKNKPLPRRFYAHLIEESEELESFLDDHCARDNKTWYFFGELVACIRNLSKVAFILKHLLYRYPAYELYENEAEGFLQKMKDASIFIDGTIISLYQEIRRESKRRGMAMPKGSLKEDFFREIYPQKRLPYTIDGEEGFDAQKIAAGIGTQYLRMIEKWEYFEWNFGKVNSSVLKDVIPALVNEERSREVITLIHNLQSTYDHYIKHTPLESQDEALKRFRGYISLPLHLLNVINWLSHLYQRHIHTAVRHGRSKEISHIVNGTRILDIMVNYALFYTNEHLQTGKRLADDILGKYITLGTCELRVPENLGFHLRPATLVARVAAYYGTQLCLIVDGQEYDASSILSITMAAGLIARKGHRTVVFMGDERALRDLKRLSDFNYGEDERGNRIALPPDLSHLWS